MDKIIEYLFTTKALVVSDGYPFWYTSGDFGPFYVNTHYLYGSKEEAEALLTFIDQHIKEPSFEHDLTDRVIEQYDNNTIYRSLINSFVEKITVNTDLSTYDYISGGERRDWFFSIIVAKLLNKSHIFLYKDNSSSVTDLKQHSVLHISDLINTASSYGKNWKPAIESANGQIKATYTIVDRLQGGDAVLANIGITLFSLIRFDMSIFEEAYENAKLNKNQLNMIVDYLENPEEFMYKYIKNHQSYLSDSIKSGGKEKQRALLFMGKYDESK